MQKLATRIPAPPPESVPGSRLTAARLVVVATALCAAVGLAWSLNIPPGDRMFYPATFGVAIVYFVGSALAAGLTRAPLPWHLDVRAAREALGAGLALAAMFCAGAFLVRYVPFLQEPVQRLLDHARVGSLALVALTTAVNGVAEETFYRGALWRLIQPRARVAVTTVAYTAVTAAVGIPLLALAAATLGLVAAYLRRRHRSLAGPVLVHLTWSGIMLFVLPHIVS